MNRRKGLDRSSPLVSQLLQGMSGLRSPSAVPESSKGSEADRLAYCHLLVEATGEMMCNSVDCIRCPLLHETLSSTDRWLCSGCAKTHKVRPFWTDGDCEVCGEYSIVLTLVTD